MTGLEARSCLLDNPNAYITGWRIIGKGALHYLDIAMVFKEYIDAWKFGRGEGEPSIYSLGSQKPLTTTKLAESEITDRSGMKDLELLLPPPRQFDEPPKYEPFPLPDEPVFASHPAFEYDISLGTSLAACGLSMWLIGNNCNGGFAIKSDREWPRGNEPIPPEILESMLTSRNQWLEEEGLPLSTLIGFQVLPDPPKSTQAKWRRTRKQHGEAIDKHHYRSAGQRIKSRKAQRQAKRGADQAGVVVEYDGAD